MKGDVVIDETSAAERSSSSAQTTEGDSGSVQITARNCGASPTAEHSSSCSPTAVPRVAFFTDSYFEVNGVAHTSRQLEAFARARHLPFLGVRGGVVTKYARDGALRQLTLRRGPLSLRLDDHLRSDLLLWRHASDAVRAVEDFQPDVIHVTGPSDIGQLGCYVARRLGIPLVASWHTNLHEYAAIRATKHWPSSWRRPCGRLIARYTLDLLLRFYAQAHLLLAPNEELRRLLSERTGRPAVLMPRGVDTELFTPARRDARPGPRRLGYVGRLRMEKNVHFLAAIERALLAAGERDFVFVIVGDGAERKWLASHLRHAQFTGVLRGEQLARTVANFDLFVFPSRTDAFGNVVLEALASGVPTVVMKQGGPQFVIEDGRSGFCAHDEQQFIAAVMTLLTQPALRAQMATAARERALSFSWERVCEDVYRAYRDCLAAAQSVSSRRASPPASAAVCHGLPRQPAPEA